MFVLNYSILYKVKARLNGATTIDGDIINSAKFGAAINWFWKNLNVLNLNNKIKITRIENNNKKNRIVHKKCFLFHSFAACSYFPMTKKKYLKL